MQCNAMLGRTMGVRGLAGRGGAGMMRWPYPAAHAPRADSACGNDYINHKADLSRAIDGLYGRRPALRKGTGFTRGSAVAAKRIRRTAGMAPGGPGSNGQAPPGQRVAGAAVASRGAAG